MGIYLLVLHAPAPGRLGALRRRMGSAGRSVALGEQQRLAIVALIRDLLDLD